MRIRHFLAVAATAATALSGLGLQAASAAPAHQAAAARQAALYDTPDGFPDETAGELYPDISGHTMCKANDLHLCARDTNNSDSGGSPFFAGNDTPGPAEDTKFVPNGSVFTFRGHSYNTGLLHLTGHPGLCYGSDQVNDVLTRDCATGYGTLIGHGRSAGHDVWIIERETNRLNDLRVIVTLNYYGAPLQVQSWFANQYYRKWDF